MIGSTRRIIWDTLRLNLGRSTPFRMTLMVSETCPLRCAICSIWRNKSPQNPTLEELEKLLRANPQISWLNLTGGEIFMRSDVHGLFALIASALPRIALLNFPTAGQSPRRTVDAVRSGLGTGIPRMLVTVSFDGGCASHDRLRGREGAFERARATFGGLRDLARASKGRLAVYPGLTLSRPLLELSPAPLDDLVRDLRLSGPQEVHLNVAHHSEHYYRNTADAGSGADESALRAFAPILHQAWAARSPFRTDKHAGPPPEPGLGSFSGTPKPAERSLLQRLSLNSMERVYLGNTLEYLATGRSPLPCQALRASVFVDARMTLYPCTIFSRPIADLRQDGYSLANLRIDKRWRDTRRLITCEQCPGCWTPCEAYSAVLGSLLRPRAVKVLGRLLSDGRHAE